MKKAANTYSVDMRSTRKNTRTPARPRRTRTAPTKPKQGTSSQFIVFAVVASMAFMICLSINYRAFSEMSREMEENQELSSQIQTLTTENVALQDEIHDLKNDKRSIEREARKMGMSRPNEKILVPAN